MFVRLSFAFEFSPVGLPVYFTFCFLWIYSCLKYLICVPLYLFIALVQWLEDKREFFEAANYGGGVEEVQASLVGLNEYREREKPPKTAEWRSLATQVRT